MRKKDDSLAVALEKEFNRAIEGGELYKKCLQDEIESTAKAFQAEVERTKPPIVRNAKYGYTKILRPNYVAYKFAFEGNDENGRPYERLANYYEYGWSGRDSGIREQPPLKFQRKAIIRVVKGIEKRAEARFKAQGGES